jgi:hypothetical protein
MNQEQQIAKGKVYFRHVARWKLSATEREVMPSETQQAAEQPLSIRRHQRKPFTKSHQARAS